MVNRHRKPSLSEGRRRLRDGVGGSYLCGLSAPSIHSSIHPRDPCSNDSSCRDFPSLSSLSHLQATPLPSRRPDLIWFNCCPLFQWSPVLCAQKMRNAYNPKKCAEFSILWIRISILTLKIGLLSFRSGVNDSSAGDRPHSCPIKGRGNTPG